MTACTFVNESQLSLLIIHSMVCLVNISGIESKAPIYERENGRIKTGLVTFQESGC